MAATQPSPEVPYGRFESRPAPRFIESVQQHVAGTGCPETFPGIHPGPLSKSEQFLQLARISVARDKRPDGKMAPCPMCQPNKFLDGWLVYFPRIQAVAVIGHCCAASENRLAAQRQYEREQAIERAQDFLLECLPHSTNHAAELARLLPIAAEAERVFGRIKKDGGWYRRALNTATKGGGQLTVAEVVGPARQGGPAGIRTAGTTVETRDVGYAQLRGSVVIGNKFAAQDDLRVAAAAFASVPAISSEDDALNFVVTLSEEQRVEAMQLLERAVSCMGKAKQALREFQAFFADANLARVTAWGSHRDNPTAMAARTQVAEERSGRKVFEFTGGPHPCRIVIEDHLWTAV